MMDKQTELMLQYGPKDTCWAATYRPQDDHLLRKYFVKAATLGCEDNPMVIEFFEQMERSWNDHVGVLRAGAQRFEIMQIAKTVDIPTIQGLQHCCKFIVNLGQPVFRYHGAGNSTIEPRAYQQRLYGEIEPRADMYTGGQGSATRVAQAMRFVGIFPTSFPTITVRESAVFTNVTAYTGVMLNRQVFASNPISHTVNGGAFTLATDINFTPVTTWG